MAPPLTPDMLGRPSRVGVALPLPRWQYFVQLLPGIQAHIENVTQGKTVDYVKHLGGGMYIQIQSAKWQVDIKSFMFRNDVMLPTEKAITLKFSELQLIKNAVSHLNRAYPPLTEVVPCHAREDHNDSEILLTCKECNPVGHEQGYTTV